MQDEAEDLRMFVVLDAGVGSRPASSSRRVCILIIGRTPLQKKNQVAPWLHCHEKNVARLDAYIVAFDQGDVQAAYFRAIL